MRLDRWAVLSVCLGVAAVSAPSHAGHLLVSANDGKLPMVDGAYRVADAPVPDTLAVLDVSAFPPRVAAEVEVQHSVTAPPTAVAITPDEKLALVSAPNRVDPADKTKVVTLDTLQVVDLEASPPAVVARVALGSHPLGLSVNRAGDLALVAHVTDGTISVLSIQGKTVTLVGKVKVGGDQSRVSHVAISPDGKWALAGKRGENTVAVLTIDGTKVVYTGRDITVGSNPYAIDITPDGRLAVVANVGRPSGDADTITLVDMTLRPIRAVDHIVVGPSPEGLAISPDGRWLAVGIANGTNRPKNSPFRNEQGKLLLFALQGITATRVAEAPTGRNTQGLAFTPDSRHVLVQNYVEGELAAYRLTGTGLEDTGVRLKVPGSPAAIRLAPR